MRRWSDHICSTRPSDGHGLAELSDQLGYSSAAWSRERGLERPWIRANLARVGPHGFYEAIGCCTVKDQRVHEYPL